mgnify:FL=1
MKEENQEEILGCGGSCSACAGCGHDHEMELPEDFEPVITLTDDKGNDVRFEILDVVVLEDGKEYLILTEADKEEVNEDVEVTILEIKQEDGEEVYDTVTDDAVAEKVFNKFVEQQDEGNEE